MQDDHDWRMGWIDTEKPHPGFGGSQNIYGYYIDQCFKCGMYSCEYFSGGKHEGQACGEIIRSEK